MSLLSDRDSVDTSDLDVELEVGFDLRDQLLQVCRDLLDGGLSSESVGHAAVEASPAVGHEHGAVAAHQLDQLDHAAERAGQLRREDRVGGQMLGAHVETEAEGKDGAGKGKKRKGKGGNKSHAAQVTGGETG